MALVATGAMAGGAGAATYTVGTTSDTAGACEEPAAGTCSLRELITYENNLAATPKPADTIVVPANSYFLENGVLTVTQSLTIAGAGARTTSIYQFAKTPDRVFLVEPNLRTGVVPGVVISGLAILFGHANEGNGFGGDILNAATLTLSEDQIGYGTAGSSGGGISNDGGALTVIRSLIYNNTATNGNGGGSAGAIQNYGPNPVTGEAAKLLVENSTIANNTAAQGGGVFSWCNGTEGACSETAATNTATIVNSTITGNDGGSAGGGLLVSQGTIRLQNSIVAQNTIDTPATGTPSNCSGPGISSLGHNLESAGDCGFTGSGELQKTDPKFMAAGLQDNGGNTDTFALQAASPALDAVPLGAQSCGVIDQRRIVRPQGSGCDIGAYELFQPFEGQQFSEVVGAAGVQEGTTPTVDWGDGTSPSPAKVSAGTGQLTGTHTYAKAGIYHASYTYSNSDGFAETRPFDTKVQDVALTASGVPVSATAGVAFSAPVATVTDANPLATAADFTATIAWGDATTSAGTVAPAPGGGFTVTGSHSYALAGVYPTSVAIKDAGGSSATAASTVTVAPPPIPTVPSLSNEPPSVLTSTSAAFTATVNPHGLATTVHFEYGPVLPQAKTAAISYGSVTPEQAAGSDFADHTVTATVTGLLPNVVYHARAVATNSAGVAQGADQTLKTPADPPPPPPVLGKTANVAPVSGIVYIQLPPGAKLASVSLSGLQPQAFAALSKGRGFIPLTEARQIPLGSILEASGGVASITTATTASPKGKLQSGDFGAGIFKLLQSRKQRGLTELHIIDNHSARTVCTNKGKGRARTAASRLKSKVLGRLRANSHGHFTARGQYSSATVRGTIWGVQNRCDGTLTRVTRGALDVRDFRRRKTIRLYTGHTYLARAPVKRRG